MCICAMQGKDPIECNTLCHVRKDTRTLEISRIKKEHVQIDNNFIRSFVRTHTAMGLVQVT